MILKDETGKEYTVHFSHTDFIGQPRSTRCIFHEGICVKNGELKGELPCDTPSVTIGLSVCSERDTFERAVGRKISMTRAIAHLPKPLRAQLWNSYRTEVGELPNPVDYRSLFIPAGTFKVN